MNQKTKNLTLSAILIALATVLAVISNILPIRLPYGGSVTLASMVPIILIGILCGTKWGLLSGVVYGVIQMLFGFYPAPTQTLFDNILVVLLDYILAFGVLGLSDVFFCLTGKKVYSVAFSAFAVTTLRYICHILSGVIIWSVYKEAEQTALAYSLIYNGSYMIPEIILSTAVTALLFPLIQKQKAR
ncbi:MAG: energy-coupled thiamine transporter ThiT [Clostridia bacterium]|nr:energy-coupled thiamine transporter ThiT [Clostridia bacterium]